MEPTRGIPPTEQLQGFILRFIQDPKHRSDGASIPSENYRDFSLLYGLVKRVQRLAHAYMKLRRLRFASEGEVLVRAALEHAVTAQYAYLTKGGVDRLAVTLERKQKEWAEAIASSLTDPKAKQWADEMPVPTGKGLPEFTGEGMMGELDEIEFLKVTYKVLSQVGHVSHESWTDTFVDVDGQLQIRESPDDYLDHEILYCLAGFCLLVAWITARLEQDDDEIDRLRQYGVAMHLPWRLDTHLPAKKRRFPSETN